MKFIARTYLILLTLTAFFSSCMKEDLSDCDDQLPTVALRFVYTHHDHTEEPADLFSEYVDDVHIYIFDMDDTFIQSLSITQELLTEGNTIYLSLDEGEYKVVTWGNLYSTNYEINPQTEASYTEYSVEAKENHSAVDDLFYGTTRLLVTESDVTEEVSLICNTHIVRIRLLGLPEPSRNTIEGTDYSVWIEGSNTLYNFDNHPAAGTATTYIPEYSGFTYDNTYIVQAEFMIQRLFTGDDLTLKILQGEYIRQEERLTERILDAYQEINTDYDLNGQYIYELYYEWHAAGFVFIGTNLEDWKGTPMPGDL